VPRGDGQEYGNPRRARKRVSLGDFIPKGLARRQRWWDNFGTKEDSGMNRVDVEGRNIKYTKYDAIISYRRPGSQKK